MARKLIVCVGIFLSLFTGFMFLDQNDDKELSKKGPGVLKIQQSDMDEVETANYVPFGSREYVRIVPQ
ncbi:hypothetical protein M3172_23770 [Mesobacillus subterraneus]|jgi:hypothetical protein|uniref:hypothetical protein n=1 Tax=Mesobacillus subterraneus TaxID=285983 RepID=UPI00203F57CF|nr:hypothetical protein [Mesobacillus subterraneus]MCM3576194.1 hypothetical protein [Mesobacillus subterraneus]